MTMWLKLFALYQLFHCNGTSFVISAHRNYQIWGSNERNTRNWSTTLASRTYRRQAFIQTDEKAKTSVGNDDSFNDVVDNATNDDANIIETSRQHGGVSGNAITVSAVIDLPFPKDVAYDAFSDLSRQSTFSPWLKAVEYIDGERHCVGSKTRWTLSYLGLRFTWNAISTLQDPSNGIIEWESITGLQNNGRVTFEELSDDRTHMNMTMSFVVPRFAARILGPHKLASIVERRILDTTIQNFRQNVIENDWKQIQQQQQQLVQEEK
jgi:uncharacterized membrane protein